MARTSRSAADWERMRRQQEREAERHRKAAEATRRAAEREAKARYVAARKREAEERTEGLRSSVRQLETLLAAGLRRSARIDFAQLLRRAVDRPFTPGALELPVPRPAWVAPPEPGAISRVFGGRARHEATLSAARDAHERAVRAWEAAETERQQRLVAARRVHAERMEAERRETETHNRAVEREALGVRQREREPVLRYLQRVVDALALPASFPRRIEVTYGAHNEQAAVEMQLPGRDVVPTVREYKYVQTRDELQPVPRPAKDVGELYRNVVAQTALLCLREVFDADPALETVAFNGHVDTTNPGTGRREYPCLISLNVTRESFEELVLDKVTPAACLKHLRALVSPHPYDLEPITPILNFDLTKYAFVDGLDVVSSLDSRPDLMALSPTEFEHLVRQVFEAKGIESWNTVQSKDDGVDAVVENKDSLLGRLTIVQAKRYSKVVGVNHIRELAGAIEEKKAGHGILVTTSWFTAGGWQKARDHGRIELIDGPRLKALILEHLGKDVVIGVDRPPNAPTGPKLET